MTMLCSHGERRHAKHMGHLLLHESMLLLCRCRHAVSTRQLLEPSAGGMTAVMEWRLRLRTVYMHQMMRWRPATEYSTCGVGEGML